MRVFRFDIIDSTNTYLKNTTDIREYDLVIAKTQEYGRGRREKEWYSGEGGAWFSFVIKEDLNISISEYQKLPMVVGKSVLSVLQEILPENEIKFKWVNDIYCGDRKISGILVEKRDNYFIIGIGININNKVFGNYNDTATSLSLVSNREFEIEEIIFKVIDIFRENYSRFLRGEWLEMVAELNNYDYLFNKMVVIEHDEYKFEGKCRGINEAGELVIEGNEGIFSINSGTIKL